MEAGGEKRDNAGAGTGLPAETNDDAEGHPALVRAYVDELMDLLIEINERWREVVQLRENTREVLRRLRTA
jgi:hypothetical protein